MAGQVRGGKVFRSQGVRWLKIDGQLHQVEAHRLWVGEHGADEQKALLHEWPVLRPGDWLDLGNAVTSKKEQSRWEVSFRAASRLAMMDGRPRRSRRWACCTRCAAKAGTNMQKRVKNEKPQLRPPRFPKERDAWRLSLERSRPFGEDAWAMKLASQLGLEHTIRREGRPTLEKADVEPKY